jgi:hypothetical protein
MATRSKTKPAAAKKAPAKKKTAPKATAKAATKPKVPDNVLAEGTFAKFNGYRADVSKDEAAFEEGQVIYIIGTDESDEGLLYNAIPADQVSTFQEDGEDAVEGGQVAPSELTELKGGALDKAREAFMPIPLVGRMEEILAEADGDPIEAAVLLNNDIQEAYFYMGGALARALQEGKYLTENGGDYSGDEAWSDFCQAEFGFKGSKGRQLARIYSTFSALPDFDPEKLVGIGWSIANKAEKYVTAENVDEVLETAAGETQRTVDAVLQEKFSVAGVAASGRATSRGEKLVTKKFNFSLDEAAGETVELVLQQCMKQNGIDNMNFALERICTEWAQDHIEATSVAKRIQGKANKAAKARQAREAEKSSAKEPAKAAAKKPAARSRKKAA